MHDFYGNVIAAGLVFCHHFVGKPIAMDIKILHPSQAIRTFHLFTDASVADVASDPLTEKLALPRSGVRNAKLV